MMRILIDLQGAQSKSRFRGIGRYTLSLARSMIRNRGDHEISILLSGLFPETLEGLTETFSRWLPPENILVFHATGPVDALPDENRWRQMSAEAMREKFLLDCRPDIVLVSSLFEGSSDNTVTSIKSLFPEVPTAVVLYDLIPLLNPERYISWEPLKRWYFRKLDSLRRADLLLGISESASAEGRDHLGIDPEQIVTISTAADEMFESVQVDDAQASSVLERFGIRRRYVMHSSAYEPRKNFEGLIRAFALLPERLRREYQLVLVCRIDDAGRAALEALAAECGLAEDELVLTGYVSDEELIALYARCRLFVFPSFHEGFGLPILEAMWCGTPAIGSNTSSIPEVIGREDALFDPHSPASIAAVMERVLGDQAFWQELTDHAARQCRRFNWDHTARTAIDAFERFHAAARLPILSEREAYQRLMEAIASIDAPMRPGEEDIVSTAVAIDKNEKEARRALLSAQFPPLKWRIEGPFDSSYSLALLNRETARALDDLGHFVILHSTEGGGDFPPDPSFLQANPDLALMHERAGEYPHEAVDVASRNLYPPRVGDMHAPLNLLHHYAWEESGFPSEWAEDFNASLDGITCLSEHVRKILTDAGVTVPLLTSGCGVDHWERIVPDPDFRLEATGFCFLHVSSCFPRKGVDDLLEAYGRSFTADDEVTLVIKTFPNPHNELGEWLASARSSHSAYPRVVVIEEDLSPETLRALYRQCHVLVSPSRAEGYGLPMAEAMLDGLPVITTGWGGQLDFCDGRNSFLVDYRFERAQSHFNLFGSVWAAVDVDALSDAMRRAFSTPAERLGEMAREGRRALLEQHTWRSAASRLVHASQRFSDVEVRTPKIGWITTYNTKCGIATYSEHLIAAMGTADITVLAPFARQTLASDAPFVRRCWHAAKEENRFDMLGRAMEAIGADAVVIQFNYGFFHFGDFAEFLHALCDAGKTVIVMMHSTTDPYGDTPNYRLAEIVPALRRVARILVHSIPDLNRLKQHGLVSNVALFPHGVLAHESQAVREPSDTPLIATYGFALPHKGLPELLHALRLLLDSGHRVRMRFVTALYPDPVSARTVDELQDLIADLDLSGHVELHTDFLTDEESLALLEDSDLLVFAYQHTGESASGAVRYGFATGRPVAITPLAIFDDVRPAAHVLEGTSPRHIAGGIVDALQHIRSSSERARDIASRSEAWRAAHAYAALAPRLYRIISALHNRLD